MSETEKLSLVHGGLGAPWGGEPKPPGAIGSAGYVEGIPRLGIPALQETDAELGVTDPGNIRPGDTATAMPSDLALASTWDIAAARRQGEAVADEARARGFNVLLGGAANLIRDPRGGRNFEYFSEDPLLTGVMAGETIAGAQSRRVISTIKHFALNAQETDRVVLDARIDPAAARESDLLAFEIAIERGRPGAVMCAYNQINGVYSCENEWLLGEVLKQDWRYPGFVMSDWGAVHSTVRAANAGLDQESGEQLDTQNFFERSLAQALADGSVPQARLDDMVRRILTSMFAGGLCDDAVATGPPDLELEQSNGARHRAGGRRPAEKRWPVAAFRANANSRRHRRPRRSRRALGRRFIAGGPARRRCGERANRQEQRRDIRSRISGRRDPSPVSWRSGRIRRRARRRARCAKRREG